VRHDARNVGVDDEDSNRPDAFQARLPPTVTVRLADAASP